MAGALYIGMNATKTIRNTMTVDDREPYTVGEEGTEKVKIKGTRMAARYAYDRGLLVMDCQGIRYGTALECVTWGRPILIRE